MPVPHLVLTTKRHVYRILDILVSSYSGHFGSDGFSFILGSVFSYKANTTPALHRSVVYLIYKATVGVSPMFESLI